MLKQKIIREGKSYIVLTFALFMACVGWAGFIIPSGIVGGGVTGLSSMFYLMWGWDVGVSVLVINSFLVLLAIKVLGFSTGVKSIYGIVLFAAFLSFLMAKFDGPVVKDTFMATLIGATLSGTGAGLIFVQGGSTGGTDILAMIINKYRNISLGKLLLVMDVLVILSSYFVFHDIEKVMYGFIMMGIYGYSIDMVISGNKSTVQLFIISKKYQEISNQIVNVAGKGVTILDGTGGFTGEEKKILMVIAKKRTSSALFRIIRDIDPDAFVTMATVAGAYGQGFEEIRV